MGGMTGMTTGSMRDCDAFCDAIQTRNDAWTATTGMTVIHTDYDHDYTMSTGWADHYPNSHPMNRHNFWFDHIINTKGISTKGNAGYVRFTNPYWDARDTAWINGATPDDARAAGYKAMMDTYGVDAPFWAWWD